VAGVDRTFNKRRIDHGHLTSLGTAAESAGLMLRDCAMLNLVSLIIGGVALVLAGIAFLPLLGWANWLIIPLAVIGAGIGMVSRGSAGRDLNLLVILIGVVRLMMGGGLL
jgi:hypothetical protein